MGARNTILVVDDEPDVADLIRLRFRRHMETDRFRFFTAQDGLEALAVLEREPSVDVVLTDIRMPRMDGLKLLSRLEDLDRSLRAIVLTAYGDMENLRTAMNRGAFDFLTKPFDLEDLEITIEKALRAVERQKRADHVHELFGRYLSQEVLVSLLEDPKPLRFGGERRRVTLLMADLRSFSRLAERLPPEAVVEILNIYLGRMTEVIVKYQGTIDEFIGDAIFVIFGAPIRREDDPQRAAACAVDMQLSMLDVNSQLQGAGYRPLEMGIALNTGEAVVGNIGSPRRAKYGAVGSPVNLVSRIESCTVGGQILISENTLAEIRDFVRIGRSYEMSVKGFAAPVQIYELEGMGPPHNLELRRSSGQPMKLSAPLPCTFSVFEGERLLGEEADGEILSLSETRAEMRTETSLEPLSDLRLVFRPDGPDRLVEELYAKVTSPLSDGVVNLRFTSLPGDVWDAIQQCVGSA